jgi:hypothetical protein
MVRLLIGITLAITVVIFLVGISQDNKILDGTPHIECYMNLRYRIVDMKDRQTGKDIKPLLTRIPCQKWGEE